MEIGYARVSTDDQNLALQHDALKKAGFKRIIQTVRCRLSPPWVFILRTLTCGYILLIGSANLAAQAEDTYLSEICKNGLCRWSVDRMPLKVYIADGTAISGYRPALGDILKQAFADWSTASGGLAKFIYVGNPQQAEIACNWTHDRSQMTSQEEDGQAVLIPGPNGLLRADILLLTLPAPSADTLTDSYARRVALHEVGHALGISGHSSASGDVMYRTSDPLNREGAITDRDKNTLAALYSAKLQGQPQLTNQQQPGAGNSAKNSNVGAQVIKLNNEAAAALGKNQLNDARLKLEEAHKLDPNNALVNANLGSVYANYAAMATMVRNFVLAESCFKKAIPLLEQGPNKAALMSVLLSYSTVLRMENKTDEANKMQDRLKELQSGK